MSWPEMDRRHKARLHHVCVGGHVISPGDTYFVTVQLPGSGAYPEGDGNYDIIDWEFGFIKQCSECYMSTHVGTRCEPPIHRALTNPKYRKAFEQALRQGHDLVCDHEANARFTCRHRLCGKAILMPAAIVYGTAITLPCRTDVMDKEDAYFRRGRYAEPAIHA